MPHGPVSITAAIPLVQRGFASLRRRLPLAERSAEREMIDEPDLERGSLDANLRDLGRLNRLPGGASASIAGIEAVLGGVRDASILDVGTGAGDLPAAFARHARRRGHRWRVIALDNRDDVLGHAAAVGRDADVVLVHGEAARLPIADASVDVAHASLLLHHFDPAAAVACLAEMRRVARFGVVVNDLRRGIGAFLVGAPAVLALGRSSMTRHDGLVSLRRAYTVAELDAMLDEAGLEVRSRSSTLMPRVVSAAIPRAGR